MGSSMQPVGTFVSYTGTVGQGSVWHFPGKVCCSFGWYENLSVYVQMSCIYRLAKQIVWWKKPHETTPESPWCQLRTDSCSMVSRAFLLNTPTVELSLGYHATVWWFLLLGVFPDIHLKLTFLQFSFHRCFFLGGGGGEKNISLFVFYEHKIQRIIWGFNLLLTHDLLWCSLLWTLLESFFLLIFVNHETNLVIKEIKITHDLKPENICWFFSSPCVY